MGRKKNSYSLLGAMIALLLQVQTAQAQKNDPLSSAGYFSPYFDCIEQIRESDVFVRRNAAGALSHGMDYARKLDEELKLTRDEVLGRDTYLANITGIPAISVPCGFGEAVMPVGFQLMGHPFDEPRLYQIAYACEQALPVKESLCPMANE